MESLRGWAGDEAPASPAKQQAIMHAATSSTCLHIEYPGTPNNQF